MNPFDMWKKGFDAWENATAQYLEQVMRSSAVLEPSGAMLTGVMKVKKAREQMLDAWWKGMGLPTRRDQERSLHELNQMQSRLIDLEEELADLRERKSA